MRGDDLDQTSLLGVELTAVNHQVGVGHAADGDEHGDPQAQVAGGGDDETSPHELNGVNGFAAARLNPQNVLEMKSHLRMDSNCQMTLLTFVMSVTNDDTSLAVL